MKSKLRKKIDKILLRAEPRRYLFLDNHDIKKSIYLAGMTRSGTTWLQDIINYKNEMRTMFEPFHSKKCELVREFRFRQYIRPESQEEKYLLPAQAILSGGLRNIWVDNFNKKFNVNKRIIKDVRTNLMLKWLKQNFGFIPFVYIMRHPCAVSVSRRERGFETHLNEYLEQEELMEDHLVNHESVITGTNDLFDKHILMWCVENYVPLQQFKKGEMHIVFYENLCLEPLKEIKKIFSFLGEEVDLASNQLINKIKLPSALSREGSAILQHRNLISDWENQITKQELKSTRRLLENFGLDHIYDEDVLPKIEADKILSDS